MSKEMQSAGETVEVFFYGLFMNSEVLSRMGYDSADPRLARLEDYDLRIGRRVTLVPCVGERVFGVVMRMDSAQLSDLYSQEIVSGYVPSEVTVVLSEGVRSPAICYLLPETSLVEANSDYARSLRALGESLGFPADYLRKIDRFI